jgi:UDP-N-acetylglucosamine 2-epimerase (non-hydrolysing)
LKITGSSTRTMNKLKLVTIVGTRPEIIKLSETIKLADKCFNHSFVHTGQNYDYNLSDIFYDCLNLRKPDCYLNVVGNNLGETIGNVIEKSYNYLTESKPDVVLILGDTNSALSVISAKRLKIPVFHIEAGNRCFDENLPEEINRRMIDHISDVNLAYSEHARRNLLNEGLKAEFTFVVGSPMREIIQSNDYSIDNSDVLEKLNLKKREYIILSAHREENIDNEQTFYSLMNAVNALAKKHKIPVIYSVHPRSKKYISERGFKFEPNVKEFPPFSFTDYIKLQQNAFCVVSDSGTLAEESAILHFPAVSIRTSTERHEAIDKGAFIIGGVTEESVLGSVEMAVSIATDENISDVPDYADTNFSEKIVKIIQGYTPIVNRKIWGKR